MSLDTIGLNDMYHHCVARHRGGHLNVLLSGGILCGSYVFICGLITLCTGLKWCKFAKFDNIPGCNIRKLVIEYFSCDFSMCRIIISLKPIQFTYIQTAQVEDLTQDRVLFCNNSGLLAEPWIVHISE